MTCGMKITRLGWAGLQLDAAGETAIVDLLQDATPMERFMGTPHTALPRPTAPPGTATLAPGGVLLRPARAEGEFLQTAAVQPGEDRLAQLGIAQRIVAPWETVVV